MVTDGLMPKNYKQEQMLAMLLPMGMGIGIQKTRTP
jgi:hypothetical protein